jgi:hypothetical protein
MNITFETTTSGTTYFTLSTVANVAWQNLKFSSDNYVLNTTYPVAVTNADNLSLDWGVSSANTDTIRVTAISDTQAVILCAYHPDFPTTSAIYIFNPYHLYVQQSRLTDTSLSAFAWFRQVSTNNLMPIYKNCDLWWYTSPSTDELSAKYNYSASFSNFDNTITNKAYLASALYLSSNEIDYNSYQLSVSTLPITSYLPYDSIIQINGPISMEVKNTTVSSIELSASQYNIGLPTYKQLKWKLTPFSTEILSSKKEEILLTFNTSYSAATGDWINISTTDFTNSYVYSLSSYTGEISGTFRPYLNITQNTTLTATVSSVIDDVQQHQYFVSMYGITDNILHNLPSNYYLIWKNTTNNNGVYAKKTNNVTYNFNTINTVYNIEDLNLYIAPSITTTSPRLCTYNFVVSALSGNNTTNAVKYTDFTIYLTEWYDDTLFKPQCTFQYEPLTLNTTYRPLTSGNYRISNDSIIPASTVGNLIYTFNDLVTTIPFDSINGSIPTEIYHTFDCTVPHLCTIDLTVQISANGFTDYVTKNATQKSVVFTQFPNADNWIIYPEFQWNGSTWGQVVYSKESDSGTVLLSSAGLSAYSFCHTENFFVSSSDKIANQYIWSVQNSLDNSDQTVTTLTSPTGWLAVASPQGTTYHSICAALYTSALPTTMPSTYYDTISGALYQNFSTTFLPTTGSHKKHIEYYGIESSGLEPNIIDLQVSPMGIPSYVYLTGGYLYNNGSINNTPFNYYIGGYSFLLSSVYSQVIKTASLLVSTAPTNVYINVDDVGSGYLSFPKYETNILSVIPIIEITPSLKISHPSALNASWCFTNTPVSTLNNKQDITVYPMTPVVYTPNKYVVTGTDIKFENLIQCFSGVQDITWTDRGNDYVQTTCTNYVTNVNNESIVDLILTTHFSSYNSIIELQNEFQNIVNVDTAYTLYDENVDRVYQSTKLELPYDYDSCAIGDNDWLVENTFNASMTKLYNNLEYLQYMSELYDVPPTEYYGWLGTIYYANSSKHFKWYVNIPNISYGYNNPDWAIDDKFTNLKDCYVKNNVMYVSNGTNVYILSSDFKATQISTINYKTIGDYFTNINSIKLDSDNRIYLLDTIDENNVSNGSKNRIIVFEFNENDLSWTLLYNWGGLGGPNAKTKFNNPKDLYVDKLNNIWVADTGNNVVKKFTRTGSWLQTLNIDHFKQEAPLSVTLDENNNIYVLTSSKIAKFDSNGNFIKLISLTYNNAKTIRPCSDDGFGYICYSDKIIKIMYHNETQSIFANNDFVNYTENYKNVYHDEFKNLYIITPNHILKYIDKLFIVKINQDIVEKSWPLESLLINSNEYIQDWVINRCLNRFWDNLELFRKSLLGKFAYKTIQNTTSVTMLSTFDLPNDLSYFCDQDFLYSNGKIVTIDVVSEYLKPVVRSFTTEEYQKLPYTKDEIYIGVNEFVTAPVLCRPIKKLFECEEVILDMIK